MAESGAESKSVFGNNCSIDNEDVEVHPYFSLYYPILDPTITFTDAEEKEPLECYSSTEAQSQDQDNSSLMRTSYLQKYAVRYGTQNYDVLSRQKNKNPTASTAVTTTKKIKQERKSNIKKTFPQKLGNQSKIQSRIPSTLSKGKKTTFFLMDHRIYPPLPRHPKNNSKIIHEINITASPSDIAKSKLADGATTHKQPSLSSQSLLKKSPARFPISDSANASNNLETSREGETFSPCRKISNHHMASKIPDATRTNRDSQEAICEKDATETGLLPFHRSHGYGGINAIELTHEFWWLQSKKVTEAHKELERELFGRRLKWNIFFSTFENDFPELSMLDKWYRDKKQRSAFRKRVKRHLFGNKWYEEKKEIYNFRRRVKWQSQRGIRSAESYERKEGNRSARPYRFRHEY